MAFSSAFRLQAPATAALNTRQRCPLNSSNGPGLRRQPSLRLEAFQVPHATADGKPEGTPKVPPLKPLKSSKPTVSSDDKQEDPPAALIPPPEDMTETDPRFSGFNKVLVSGATGGVGRELVKDLLKKGVKVKALVRDLKKAGRVLPVAAEFVEGNVYQYADVVKAVEGVDAIICASSATTPSDPLGPFSVDYTGTVNLVEAAKAAGVSQFVLVSSIGTDGTIFNPLNLFWGILFWKKRAEEHLQRSGLASTIIRPGGLVSSSSSRSSKRGEGNVVMARSGTYGFPPLKSGSILRSKVAECCTEALVQGAAEDSVVEIIADTEALAAPWDKLFAEV